MSVAVAGLGKTYRVRERGATRAVRALDGVDLAAAEGELVVVVGPSASGKSTLLRCIAGLEDPEHGRIEVGGKDVTAEPPGSRDLAMVFQEFALYPHLTVAANIEFGLKARKVAPAERRRLVDRAVRALELGNGLLQRRPGELSGGERQRVALARAIVREPKAFLMDEPLSNLDAELRTHARREIRALQRRLGTTMIYVTHDQVEAMTLGDRVAVLREGKVVQVDTPMGLYDRPANSFVARFVGSPPMNVFPSAAVAPGLAASKLGLRPERIRLVASSDGRVVGRVVAVEAVGSEAIVHLEVAGYPVLVRADPHVRADVGAEMGLSFRDEDLYSFEGPDEKAVR